MAEANKLYVGNLPYKTSEDELRSLFEEYGTVSDVAIVMDRDTGRAKGFGFVTYNNEEDAMKAIDKLDGTEIEGREIRVNKAKPRGGGGGGGGFGRGGGGYGGGGGGYGGGGRY